MLQNILINTDSNLKQIKVIKKRFLGKELPNLILENEKFLNFGIINNQFTKGKFNLKIEFIKNDENESYFRLGFINYLFCKNFEFPPNINNLGLICFKQYSNELFIDGKKLTITNPNIFNIKDNENPTFQIIFCIKNENNPNLILPTLNEIEEKEKIKVIYDKFQNNDSDIEFYYKKQKINTLETIKLIDGIYYPYISLFGNCRINIYFSNNKKNKKI